MQQLIELSKDQIICDDPKCDYIFEVSSEGIEEDINVKLFINMPCPQCGENLLTVEDYLTGRRFKATVNWLNKWFSWLTLIFPVKKNSGVLSVHAHKGKVRIKKNLKFI